MAGSLSREVRVFDSIEALSGAAALELTALAHWAIEKRSRFCLALSGGGTPAGLYRFLSEEMQTRIQWEHVHIFWGDERFVPFDDPQSNFRSANELFISRIPVPQGNVHPIPVDAGSPGLAADEYENTLREFFGSALIESMPLFDLILLGVGADGHTASLFPGAGVLEERERLVMDTEAASGIEPRARVTLTLPAINGSRCVFFLAAGREKREAIRAVLEEPGKCDYPAARVNPREQVIWFLDYAAAGRHR